MRRTGELNLHSPLPRPGARGGGVEGDHCSLVKTTTGLIERTLHPGLGPFWKGRGNTIAKAQGNVGSLGRSFHRVYWLLFIVQLLAWLPCPSAYGQAHTTRPKFYDLYEKRYPGDTNRFKSIVSSEQAEIVGQNLYRGKGMRIANYSEEGSTNIIIQAPECLLNWKERTATSTNRLELETGNGLRLEGYGYFCELTNFTLWVSNKVRTRIQRSLAESNRGMIPAISSATAVPAGAADTNVFLTIYSDQFYLNSASNLIVYTGNVRVDNAQAVLSCQQLTIKRATNGSIESILGVRNVVIVNKADQSRASGDRALYSIRNGRETLDLTGHALWLEGQRSCRAESFSFDLLANTVEARRKALLKLPRTMITQTDLFPGAGPAKPATQVGKTNQMVELHSDWMKIQLPGSNHPPRSIVARTNVLLLSDADFIRATGGEAVLNEGTGLFELNQKASWQADQRLVKGDRLLFDRTNRVFQSLGNGYLWIPLASFGKQSLLPQGAQQRALSQFLELTAHSIEYQGDWLTLNDQVRGKVLEGNQTLARLESGFLAVQFSNQVKRVVAKKRVFIEELPVTHADKRRISKTVRCENLDVNLTTNGLLQRIIASGKVRGVQEVYRPNQIAPSMTVLDAERVTADFFSHTNQVKDIVAERNVVIRNEDRTTTSDMAVYLTATDVVILSGNASAKAPDVDIKGAEIMRWDRKKNTINMDRMVAEGTAKAFGSTNRSGLPSPKPAGQPDVRKP